MLDKITTRQHQILELLLKNRNGLSIDSIAATLEISRTAVLQHFASLQRDDFIHEGATKKTAGRPVRSFKLTTKGINYFPKQYAWFSELLLTTLKQELGSDGFRNYMNQLGTQLAENLAPRFAGKSSDAQFQELIDLMQELGYRASKDEGNISDGASINAYHCVYHDLAQKHREICEFDQALMATLLNSDIELEECQAKGGGRCRFKISPKN